MTPERREPDVTAKNDFEAPQRSSLAKPYAQDIAGGGLNGANENPSSVDVNKEEILDESNTNSSKTVEMAEESNFANDTSRKLEGNAMSTGVSVKEEEENPTESKLKSNPDPYEFSDQDSSQRDDADTETSRINSNNIDVKMENEAGIVDDEHEDFDVDDKT